MIMVYTFIEQEAFEKCWAVRHNEPPHDHSSDVASGTVAHRLRIDVNDDNVWQRGPLWLHEWAQLHEYGGNRARQL